MLSRKAFGEGGGIRGGRILNTGTKGHPEALEGLEEGDEPHRLSYIRQANTHVPRKEGESLTFWKHKAHQKGIRIYLDSQIHELRTKSK